MDLGGRLGGPGGSVHFRGGWLILKVAERGAGGNEPREARRGGDHLVSLEEYAHEADSDAPDRVVCHVDMDCFYASCERLRHDDLDDEPVVVGMGYEPGESIGAVATASYEARAFGVESAMPISEALELLPRRADADPDDPDAPDPAETGRYIPVDLDFYEDVAGEVKAVLRDCADTRREVSIDEAYLDVTDRTAWTVAGSGGAADGGDADPADPPPSAAAMVM